MKKGRGRPAKKLSREGSLRKSMKELTETYDDFLEKRVAHRKEIREDGQEAFNELLEKAVNKRKKA